MADHQPLLATLPATPVTSPTNQFSTPAQTSANIPLSSSTWTALGPAPITNGQTPGNQPVSGRIAAVAADPTDPNTLYIAAAGGGVWKTTNATSGTPTWTPLTDSQATLSMGAIAVARSNSQVIYAGTGEANNSFDSNYGLGILVSTNGGGTWNLENDGGVFNGLTVSKIAVDPKNPNIVYAAMGNLGHNQESISGTGIYKSTDGGLTWTDTTSSINDTKDSYSDVALDPTNPSTVYMAVGPSYGSSASGVYKSTDGGGTWTEIYGSGIGTTLGRISIAVAPSNTNVVYVSIAGNTGSTGSGLYKFEQSTDGGTTWTDLTAGTPNYMGRQGFYDQTLIVDPTNSAIVYAGGQISFIESTTSGTSWSDISDGADSNGPHVDHHGIGFDASGKLLDGNDGGIWRLDNPTIGSIQWTDLNDQINTIQFEGIGLHPTDSTIALGGSQDNGTSRFTGNLGWTLTDGGDGGFVKFSQQNGNLVYRVSPVGSFGSGDFFRVSNDAGVTWSSATNGLNGNDPMNFYPPFAVDPSNGLRVVLGSNRIFQTTNGASNWAPISTVNLNGWNPNGNSVDAIGLAASDANTIYAATGGLFASSSNIYVTTNGGTTWTDISLPAGSGRVNDLEVDPTHAQIVYAVVSTFTTGGGHVFRSTNGGTNWTDISGNLPNLPTWSLQIDPTKANTLYIGNDTGVFVTSNLGTSWSPLGTGLPNAQVFQIALNTNYNTLAAGTHGRGMWEILTTSDTTPPTITATADKTTLWPPNGKLVPVTVTGTITDDSTFTASFHVVDEYGKVQPSDSITVNSVGRFSFTVYLEASRLGTDLDGRQYTIFIDALDPSGNTSELKIGVAVPHDQGN